MARGRESQSQARNTHLRGQGGADGLPAAYRFAFLQAVMSKSWMKEADVRRLFDKLNELSGGGASYTLTFADIDAELRPLLLGLAVVKYPVDGQRYVGFVNRESDDVSKAHGSSLSVAHVQYLKSLIEAIALDPDAKDGVGMLSGIDALNLRPGSQLQTQASQLTQASQATQAVPKLSMHDKEAALKLFIQQGWLNNAPGQSGHYTLGARAFLELLPMLLEFDLPEHTLAAWQSIN